MCGEGGEYETFTLDCPLFNKRIVMYVLLVNPPSNIGQCLEFYFVSSVMFQLIYYLLIVTKLKCLVACFCCTRTVKMYRLIIGYIVELFFATTAGFYTLLSTTSDLLLPASSVGHLSETKKQEGCRKRGSPQLRWEDCVKRDPRKAEEEEKWREKANNRDQQKRITKVAVVTTTPDLPLQNVKHEEKQESCPSSS